MKKCLHCGKKGKLILIDEDEKEYLCYKCNKEEENKSKERMNQARDVFGSNSDKESVLPKSLVEKGMQSTLGIPDSIDRLSASLRDNEKKLDGLQSSYGNIKSKIKDKKDLKVLKETLGKEIYYLKHEIKRNKKEIKEFKIDHFIADDVEKFFSEILDKYELVEKERIIRPRLQDIGKKHFICENCGKTWRIKKKPKKCSKCKSKKIAIYYRL